jgi:hypothetical protein
MKKLMIVIAVMVMSISTSACASGPHGHRHHGHNNWVAPLIIGGVVGAIIARPPPQMVYPQGAVIYTPPVYQSPYLHRPMYKAVDVYIPECNCTRTIHVQVN